MMQTIRYKDHYIQIKTEGIEEVIHVQLMDNPDASFSTFEMKQIVPASLHAAKLAITKHIKLTQQSC